MLQKIFNKIERKRGSNNLFWKFLVFSKDYGWMIDDMVNRNNLTKSKKTKKLSLYHTKTGIYYLPTDAYQDVIANTIKNNQIFEKEVVDLASKYIKPDRGVFKNRS